MNLTFHGAAGGVTGSNYVLEVSGKRLLIDCGQFQGDVQLEKQNHEPFGYTPGDIDAVLLTHAHIDHSGRIPLLVKQGFKGRIWCTRPTAELAELLLKDSGKIHESDAEWDNRKRERAGLPKQEPLFTEEDAIESLAYFNPIDFHVDYEPIPGVTCHFYPAGHLLGAAFISVTAKEAGKTRTIVFSGDLGMRDIPMLDRPVAPPAADYLLIESTYGNRSHERVELRVDRLVDIILETTKKGGTALIPSFAIGRTQEILYALATRIADPAKQEAFNSIPIYVDSPLAIQAMQVYERNTPYYNADTQKHFEYGKSPLRLPNLHVITSMDGSIALNKNNTPKVIISASGMCDAGRIQHHLKHHLWRSNNALIFIGYQAEGTLGRMIKDGKPSVQILGETIRVGAQIHTVEGFSGHADREDLLHWVQQMPGVPRKTFVTHGEPEMSVPFSNILRTSFGHNPTIAEKGQTVELD